MQTVNWVVKLNLSQKMTFEPRVQEEESDQTEEKANKKP